MHYVYSTASCSTAFVKYKDKPEPEKRRNSIGHNEILKKVIIKGGHGISDKHFFTPFGVVTQVSDEDMDFLLQNESFKRAVNLGFMSYDKKRIDPEKKARNMEIKDGSSPLTPKDFEKGENDSDDLRIYKGIAKAKMS